MKEYTLQIGFLHREAWPEADEILSALIDLAGGKEAESKEDFPKRLFAHTGRESLEIWLRDDDRTSVGTGLCAYRRLGLRLLTAEREQPLKVAVAVLPAKLVCKEMPLEGFAKTENKKRAQVMMDGEVRPYRRLSPGQVRRLKAVCSCVVDECVGDYLRRQGGVQEWPTVGEADVWQLEEALNQCFPTGGRRAGCDLTLTMEPECREDSRVKRVPDDFRVMQFGEQAKASGNLLEAFRKYGPLGESDLRFMHLVVLYPQGAGQKAESLYRQLKGLRTLIGMEVERYEKDVKDEEDVKDKDGAPDDYWAEYVPGEYAVGYLADALRKLFLNADNSVFRLVCLLLPDDMMTGKEERMRWTSCVRDACQDRECTFVCSLPMASLDDARNFEHWLTLLALRLLAWRGVAACQSPNVKALDDDLLVGMAQVEEEGRCIAGAVFGIYWPKPFTLQAVNVPELFFPTFFSRLLEALKVYRKKHRGYGPQRVVVYTAERFPWGRELAGALKDEGLTDLPVWVVQTRPAKDEEVAAAASCIPDGRPLDGTYLCLPDGKYLLYCHDCLWTDETAALPAWTEVPLRGAFRPLWLHPCCLQADGTLSPLPTDSVGRLMKQTHHLTALDALKPVNSALPLVLWLAEEAVRQKNSEVF
ncbi:MAG: hypothetical protein Q4D56_03760 [Bacteroides sp.]|nr:hypothetical protein [Bacteroides sp.]